MVRRGNNTSRKHSRGTKRVKEDHQQPFPDASTVGECSNHGRESCEDRVDHSQNQAGS